MGIVIRKEKGTPNVNTIGFVGEIYENINTGDRYECVGIYKSTGSKMYGPDCDYHWEKIDMVEEKRLPSGIGSGVTSWNDLKDKPFEDNKFCIEYDFAVIPDVALNDGGMYWYKISDLTPTYEELLGARVVEKYNGEVVYDAILKSEDLRVLEDSLAGFGGDGGSYTVVYKTNEMFAVSETGLYYGCALNNVEYLDARSMSMTYANIKKLDGKLVSVPRYEYIETVEVGNPTLVSAPDNGYDTWIATYETCVSDMKEAKRAEFVFEFDNGNRTCPVAVVANCTNEDEEYHFTTLFPFEFKLYAFDFMTDGGSGLGRIEIQEVCDFGALPT